MKLPRDLSGTEVAKLLSKHYDYRLRRSKGSHMTVTRTSASGAQHSVTVPRHRAVRIGTLDAIVTDVGEFMGLPKSQVRETLFG